MKFMQTFCDQVKKRLHLIYFLDPFLEGWGINDDAKARIKADLTPKSPIDTYRTTRRRIDVIFPLLQYAVVRRPDSGPPRGRTCTTASRPFCKNTNAGRGNRPRWVPTHRDDCCAHRGALHRAPRCWQFRTALTHRSKELMKIAQGHPMIIEDVTAAKTLQEICARLAALRWYLIAYRAYALGQYASIPIRTDALRKRDRHSYVE